MAKNSKSKKQVKVKTKKKIWFKIIAPKTFASKEIGETYLTKAEDCLGRIMKVNLSNLTGSMRDQNVYITLKLSSQKAQQIQTATAGYELVSTYVKRMIRKNSTRLDAVYQFTTKDEKQVVLKAIVTTFNRANKSVGTAIRHELQKELAEIIANSNFEDLVGQLVGFKIQLAMKKKLNKLFPIKEVAVRSFKLAKLKTATEVEGEEPSSKSSESTAEADTAEQ